MVWHGLVFIRYAASRIRVPLPVLKASLSLYAIPLKAGMSIGMMLISVELLIMLCILLFIPGS